MRKSGARTMLHERAVQLSPRFARRYPAVKEEIEHLAEHLNLDHSAFQVAQLSFFRDRLIAWPVGGKKAARPELMGALVLVSFPALNGVAQSYVFEAILDVAVARSEGGLKERFASFVHVADICDVTVGGQRFEIEASYFCQQNRLTTMCAHSALKTTLWHALDRAYQPATRVMNAVAATVPGHDGWKASAGLSLRQCAAICDEFDRKLVSWKFEGGRNANVAPYELAYLLQECGLPSVIVFRTSAGDDDYHVVPVVGHTLNTDEWFPVALDAYPHIRLDPMRSLVREFLPAAEWVPHLVIHDDILGPYYSLSHSSLTRDARAGEDFIGRACWVLAVAPKGFPDSANPVFAQKVGWVYLRELWSAFGVNHESPWTERLRVLWNGRSRTALANTVLRTTLVQPDQYLAHLEDSVTHAGESPNLDGIRTRLRRELGEHELVWMIEFTLPELYCGNRSKVGELLLPLNFGTESHLISATERGGDVEVPLLVRFLGALSFGSDFDFEGDELPVSHIGLSSHSPMFSRSR